MLPLVSVIIPVYNVEKYIISCLQSVFNQTYKNIEIILVDDKGTDNSMDLAIRYINEHSENNCTLVHHEVNSGLSIARNSGLNKAEGKYVFFLDSDDTLPVDSIHLLVNSAVKFDSDITIGDLMCIEEESGIKRNPFPLKVQNEILSGNKKIYNTFFTDPWPVIAPNKLYRKEFLVKHQILFEPGLLHEDELWSFICALYAEGISIVKEITYNYLLRRGSIISTRKKKNTDDLIIISKKMYSYFLKEQDKEKKQQIYFYIIRFNEQTLRIIFQNIQDKEYFKKSYLEIKNSVKFPYRNYLSNSVPPDVKKLAVMMQLPSELGYRLYRYRFYQKISSFFKK